MTPKLKSFLVLILFLVAGLAVIGVAQLLHLPEWLHPAPVVLALFVIMNIITAKVLQLQRELLTFWSVKKIYFLPVGFLAGGLVANSPLLAGLLMGETTVSQLKSGTEINLGAITLTLVIVLWEELWFRGIFLNYCNKKLADITVSVSIGFLFMILHVMNPEIDLLKSGPTLFFAGALLTLLYFYFRNIWLPVGLHFGNNYLMVESNLDKHWFLGSEGYFGAILLAILFILFVKLTTVKKKPLETE